MSAEFCDLRNTIEILTGGIVKICGLSVYYGLLFHRNQSFIINYGLAKLTKLDFIS